MTYPTTARRFLAIWSLFFAFTHSAFLTAQECRLLTVTGGEQWRPFAYNETESGILQPKGIAHDVVKMIAHELDIPINYVIGVPWKRMEKEMEKGHIDVLAGNYYSEGRAKKWLITKPIASETVNLFTLRGREFEFNTLSDLQQKRGVVPMGISLGQDFDLAREQLNVLDVRTHEQMYDMLNLERVDYLVSPKYAARNHLRKPINSRVVMLPNPIDEYNIHLSLSRASPCSHLLAEFNRIIEARLIDGNISRIVNQYIANGL